MTHDTCQIFRRCFRCMRALEEEDKNEPLTTFMQYRNLSVGNRFEDLKHARGTRHGSFVS